MLRTLSRRGFLAGLLSLPLVALLPSAKRRVDPSLAAQWELNERFHRGPPQIVSIDEPNGIMTFDRPIEQSDLDEIVYLSREPSTEWPWGSR